MIFEKWISLELRVWTSSHDGFRAGFDGAHTMYSAYIYTTSIILWLRWLPPPSQKTPLRLRIFYFCFFFFILSFFLSAIVIIVDDRREVKMCFVDWRRRRRRAAYGNKHWRRPRPHTTNISARTDGRCVVVVAVLLINTDWWRYSAYAKSACVVRAIVITTGCFFFFFPLYYLSLSSLSSQSWLTSRVTRAANV